MLRRELLRSMIASVPALVVSSSASAISVASAAKVGLEGASLKNGSGEGQARIFQLAAFTARRFAGNPASVMLLDSYPEDKVLQGLSAENNHAETAFIVPKGKDFQIRWFTPTVEVPLCGHATLASGAVVLERLHPEKDLVSFQSPSGILTVSRGANGYVMDLPVRRLTRAKAPEGLAAALGAAFIEVISDGSNIIAVLASPGDVRKLSPDLDAIAHMPCAGVVVTAIGDEGYDCVSRYFAPAKGIPEDPVTGGAHCGLTPYWSKRLGKKEINAYQASPRGGALLCRQKGDRVELEGSCVFYLEGLAQW